jgi:hypothetical protein
MYIVTNGDPVARAQSEALHGDRPGRQRVRNAAPVWGNPPGVSREQSTRW